MSITDAKLNPTPTRIEGASWTAIVVLYSVAAADLVGAGAVAWTMIVLGSLWLFVSNWED